MTSARTPTRTVRSGDKHTIQRTPRTVQVHQWLNVRFISRHISLLSSCAKNIVKWLYDGLNLWLNVIYSLLICDRWSRYGERNVGRKFRIQTCSSNARYYLSLVVNEHFFYVATVYDVLMIWSSKGGTKNIGPRQTVLLYSWRFSRYSAPIHFLVHCQMTSSNKTVSRHNVIICFPPVWPICFAI